MTELHKTSVKSVSCLFGNKQLSNEHYQLIQSLYITSCFIGDNINICECNAYIINNTSDGTERTQFPSNIPYEVYLLKITDTTCLNYIPQEICYLEYYDDLTSTWNLLDSYMSNEGYGWVTMKWSIQPNDNIQRMRAIWGQDTKEWLQSSEICQEPICNFTITQ